MYDEDDDKPRKIGSLLSKPALDDISPPRPKRRRKNMEADTDSIFNPQFQQKESGANDVLGPRRSTRSRTTRLPLKPVAPTANSALSHIPVRLPGSLNLGSDDNFASVNLSVRRNEREGPRGHHPGEHTEEQGKLAGTQGGYRAPN